MSKNGVNTSNDQNKGGNAHRSSKSSLKASKRLSFLTQGLSHWNWSNRKQLVLINSNSQLSIRKHSQEHRWAQRRSRKDKTDWNWSGQLTLKGNQSNEKTCVRQPTIPRRAGRGWESIVTSTPPPLIRFPRTLILLNLFLCHFETNTRFRRKRRRSLSVQDLEEEHQYQYTI